MTTIAVPDTRPAIICPPWCTVSYEDHLDDLPNWDGYVYHHSATRNGVAHSRAAFVDNTIDPTDLPRVYIEAEINNGLELDEAEKLARAILVAVREARA